VPGTTSGETGNGDEPRLDRLHFPSSSAFAARRTGVWNPSVKRS
jgi:hypothetical protein